MFRKSNLLIGALFAVALTYTCLGQSPNATVTGLVTDSTGNAMPNATVQLINVDTNVATKVTTNGDGLYRITGLVPGVYRAETSKEGFKRVIKDEIVLHVQDQVSLSFSLQVGSVTESITVEAGEPLLQTQTSSLSEAIEGRTVQDTPLNGRNVLNLVALVPGVVAQGSASGNPIGNQSGLTNPNGWGNYQIGGGMSNQSATFIDGAPINTSYVNSVALVPSQDSIQEFRVETNNVTPEYGRFAGGVINLSTKSGTNSFHGTAYEYIRNKVLNANNFFNNSVGLPTPPFTQNQYGAAIGGPVKKDKIFFFGNWEGFSLRSATPSTFTVPTAAERDGDFSAAGVNIYDPYSGSTANPIRTQFMGCNGNQPNVICSNRIDPTSAVLLGLFPQPNLPGVTNNFAASPSIGGNSNQYNARGDWALSDKQKIFTRYTYWNGSQLSSSPFGNSTGSPVDDFISHNAVVGDTYILNSTTVMDFRLSYLRFVFDTIPLSNGVDLSTFGPAYANLSDQFLSHQNPLPSILNVTATSTDFANQDLTIFNTNDNFTISANVTKTIGRHSITFGGEGRKIEWFYVQNNYGGGLFNFDGNFTAENGANPNGGGYPIASFLLGTPSSGSVDNVLRSSGLQWYGGVYANDSFRATSRLTFNLGLRWEQPGSFYERRNRLNVLLPDATDPLSASTGLDLKGQVALVNTSLYPGRTEQTLRWYFFSPRIGFSLQALPSTVIRGGYGISHLPNDVGFAAAPYDSPVNTAVTNMTASVNGGITPDATLSNPFPSGLMQPIGNDASRLGELEGGTPGGTLPNEAYPYAQQWNLNVEQQFGSKTVLEVGYGGSKGTHLPLYQLNVDQLPDQYDAMGPALLNPVANPFLGKVPSTSGLLGTATTIAAGYLLDPYPQYLSLTAFSPYIGGSNYNSLQVKFKRQLGAGGTILASYTWSRLISDTDTLTSWLEAAQPGGQYGTQDAYNRKADRSLSANDVPQNFVLSYVVDVPVGQNRRFLGSLHGVPQAVMGGWSLNGVSTFRSGFPLSFAAQPTVLSNDFGAGTPRPNLVPGCSRSISGSAQSRLGEWFNRDCFSQPGAYSFGDENRNDSLLRAAGVVDWDLGLFKTIPFKEQLNLQFRAEVFNLANRVQFGPPNTTYQVPDTSDIQFGVVTSQINQPRLYQFSLRANF
jgi:hypothetical protein